MGFQRRHPSSRNDVVVGGWVLFWFVKLRLRLLLRSTMGPKVLIHSYLIWSELSEERGSLDLLVDQPLSATLPRDKSRTTGPGASCRRTWRSLGRRHFRRARSSRARPTRKGASISDRTVNRATWSSKRS
ncbi:hypothetical protein B296_00026563 [Ensete ventricosum]|uniref:Uncharacterized protein n=1 Tax=Ensete ventricosum TaxID=4639 RepID=A0A426ZJ47_ENSVE|nr:hypothetical protein B296_00026563 [Ensete ventricosum]